MQARGTEQSYHLVRRIDLLLRIDRGWLRAGR
jgi:hypothetical protein